MSEFANLREELAKSRPLEFVGRDCACIGCIAHREIGLILRALAIAEVGEEVERALRDMERALRRTQDVLATHIIPDTSMSADDCVNAIFDIADHKDTLAQQRAALAALSKLKQAREG